MLIHDTISTLIQHPLLVYPGWIDILNEYQDVSPAEFVLRFGGKKSWPVREIAEQLHCYPRAANKLGPLHRSGMIYNREALEQASGYAAAGFRAREWMPILGKSNSELPQIADITGGLGVDSAIWALAGARVCYCERNRKLELIARHNHHLLEIGESITYLSGDGMEWLQKRTNAGEPPLDLLYIDPSRRPGNRRVISLDESEPSVTEHMALIISSAKQYLLKLSPMLDITQLMRSVIGLQRLVAVSVDGEVKELLAGGTGSGHDGDHIIIQAVMLNKQGDEVFRIGNDDSCEGAGKNANTETDDDSSRSTDKMPRTRPVGCCIFEPDAAILKMGLSGILVNRFQLGFVNRMTGYLTGDQLIPYFPGRKYLVRETLPWKPKKMQHLLSERGLKKVHIHQRGFPLSVEQLYEKLGCVMGDQAHLIATPDHNGRFVLYISDMA